MSFKPTIVETPDSKPATHAEIAILEFAPVKEMRRLSKTARVKKSHAMVERVRPMAVLASEIISMKKAELTARVAEKYEDLGPCLMYLADAGEDAKALAGIIRMAEMRLAVALANVEPDADAGERR